MSYDPMVDYDYDRWPDWCEECRADVSDGHPYSHEPICSKHPDYRADLEDVPHPTEAAA